MAKKKDYISYYGGLMRDSISLQVKAHGQTKAKGKDGFFLPSCYSHGVSNETKLPVAMSENNNTAAAYAVTQVGYMELLGDWFLERNKFASHMLIDDCKMTAGQPCNPTCPK